MPSCTKSETSIDVIGPIMAARAEAARVPVCVMLDHGEDLDYVRRALDLGFSAIMIDGSQPALRGERGADAGPRWSWRTSYGADVEAEIGFTTRATRGWRTPTTTARTSTPTRPTPPASWLTRASTPWLRPWALCTASIRRNPSLDFERIAELKRVCGVPLVMHGGSGLSRGDTRAAIAAGIRKINYFSYMSNAGVRAVEALIAEQHPKYFHALANAATKAMQADAESCHGNVLYEVRVRNLGARGALPSAILSGARSAESKDPGRRQQEASRLEPHEDPSTRFARSR